VIPKFVNMSLEIQFVDFFIQSKSCNLLRLLGHVEKLNAGQGLLFLTDIIKVSVEQTSCCRVVLSLSEALMKKRLRDCMISVTKIMSYIGIIINLPTYNMGGKTFTVARTLYFAIVWGVTSSSVDK
jgi:hypothetical protein